MGSSYCVIMKTSQGKKCFVLFFKNVFIKKILFQLMPKLLCWVKQLSLDRPLENSELILMFKKAMGMVNNKPPVGCGVKRKLLIWHLGVTSLSY